MGQLPRANNTHYDVFSKVSVDYAGPVYTKLGAALREKIVKSYIVVFCLFICQEAVHLEVSRPNAEAFMDCLRHFISTWNVQE